MGFFFLSGFQNLPTLDMPLQGTRAALGVHLLTCVIWCIFFPCFLLENIDSCRQVEWERVWERGCCIQHSVHRKFFTVCWMDGRMKPFLVTYNGAFFKLLQKKGLDTEKQTNSHLECHLWKVMTAWSSGLSENVRLCLGSIRKSTEHSHQCLPSSREKGWTREVRIEG